MWKKVLQVFTCALLLVALPKAAGAFKEHWHKAITFAALSFMEPRALQTLLTVHDDLDKPSHLTTAGVDKWHFNDCDFEGASSNVRSLYASAVGPAAAGPRIGWTEFGKALHIVQDFYAHSNWTDLGEMSLVEPALGEWPVLRGFQSVRPDIVAVAGKQNGMKVSRQPGDRLVTVSDPQGKTTRGLISGAAFIKKQCPREVEVGHWDEVAEQGGLAKDYPCRGSSFWPACSLAFRQTLNEWCRLLALTEKVHGAAGRAEMMKSVRPDRRKEAEDLCSSRTYLLPSFSGGCSWGS